MIKRSLGTYVGIKIDDSYNWIDTSYVSEKCFIDDENMYKKCKYYIYIKMTDRIVFKGGRFINDKIYIGDDFLIDKEFGVKFERFQNTINLTVTQECNEWLMMCLYMLLLEQNCALIHAAAVEKDGNVIMFPSWGGVGKTAVVIKMVTDAGWRLLGDDMVIIKYENNVPYVESFLKSFVIYPYHASIFPEVFASNKRFLVKNDTINKAMSKLIYPTKKLLRHFPNLHAFVRRNNPQSMKVCPYSIFSSESISSGGVLKKIIWIERTDNGFSNKEISSYELSSKIAAVSLMEVCSSRLDCLMVFNGMNMFDYKALMVNMYELLIKFTSNCECSVIALPLSTNLNDLSDCVSSLV